MLDQLRQNLESVRAEIAAACKRVDRDPSAVTLICVTKYADWDWVTGLYELGERHFGESRPQQLAEREPQIPDAHWHLIGQLQSNKARLAVQHSRTIHSIDSLKLLDRVDRIAGEEQRDVNCLLQINVSGETSKQGWSPEAFRNMTKGEFATEHCRVTGLMTMAPRVDSPEGARPYFGALRELQCDVAPQWTDLSMGMSGDFQIAIEEGATHVRVGSRLFAGC